MKNLYPQNVKTIQILLILFLLAFPAFGQAQNTSDEKGSVPQLSSFKKRVIQEDTLYERLEEFRITGTMDELRTRCGCALPRRENVNFYDPGETSIPQLFTSKAYPNPAVVNTQLEIDLPADAFMEISLLNVNGQLVQPVFSGNLLQGRHNYSIEILTLPAGMYFLTIHSEKYSATVKVMKV